MGKVIIGAIIGAAIVVAGVMFLNKPEPTPEERLKDAIENIGDATKDAAEAATDAAEDVAEAMATSAANAANEMAEYATKLSSDTKAQLEEKLTDWKESGIISDDGFDFGKATTALEESNLSEAAKKQITDILEALRDTPDDFKVQMDELKKQLDI